MKAAVTLRLRPERTAFQVFFPYSDAAVHTALLMAGVQYAAALRGYVLPATPEAVEPLRRACQQLGLRLLVPSVPALAAELPPTPAQELLSRYCQHIVLRRYSPQTLKNYWAAFQQFLVYHAPRLPHAWLPASGKPTRTGSSPPSSFTTSRWKAGPGRCVIFGKKVVSVLADSLVLQNPLHLQAENLYTQLQQRQHNDNDLKRK